MPTAVPTEYEVLRQPDPVLRHLAAKQHLLERTNDEREKAGVPTVELSDNPAAQLHAEAALRGCYSSHWDRWGLKPNARYVLSGGIGSDGENLIGSSYCIASWEFYTPLDPIEVEIDEAVQSWIESPGHRTNMLNPAHRELNMGIAYDRYNIDEAVQSWIESPGHRTNMLNPAHRELNMGIAYDRYNIVHGAALRL